MQRKKLHRHRREFLLDSNQTQTRRPKKLRNRFLNILERLLLIRQIKNLFKASIMVGILLSVMAIFIIFAVFSPYFNLKKITVVRDSPNLDVEQIDKILENFYGQNLLFLSQPELIKNLQETFPEFREIKIKENWPSEINLEITISPPLFNLLNTETANFSVISEDGVILKEEPAEDLPVIKVFQHENIIQLREKIMTKEDLQKIIKAENFLQQVTKLPLHATHLYWTARELHLISTGEMQIWIDLQQPIEAQLQKLEEAVNEIGLYTNRFEHIDLRIPKQIFWKLRK